MSLPASIIPAKRRVHRKRHAAAPAPPAPPAPPAGPPVLVAAALVGSPARVVLTFDRAVAFAGGGGTGGFDGWQVIVDAGPVTGRIYNGAGGAALVAADAVEVHLFDLGPSDAPDATLSATPATGIVAAEGAVAWEGAAGVTLPFS